MDGALGHNGGATIDWNGFYIAKEINGVYNEDKLIKTATPGTTYTFTIVDVNEANIWEIYVGSTYFGSFADKVSSYNGDFDYQGYEVSVDPNTSPAPILNSAIIDTEMYYKNKTWNNFSTGICVAHNTSTKGLTASYSSSTNKTTITKK
jgi:hypothetical protein